MTIITGLYTIDGVIFSLLLFILIVYIIISLIIMVISTIKGKPIRFNKKIFLVLSGLLLLIPVTNTIFSIKSKIQDFIVVKKYETNNFITIEAEELIKEFNVSKSNADSKYKGKVLNIVGKIYNTAQPKDYHPVTDASCLYFGDYIKDEIFITCYFNDIVTSELNENDSVQLIGNYRRIDTKKWDKIDQIEIIIGDCKIIKDTIVK